MASHWGWLISWIIFSKYKYCRSLISRVAFCRVAGDLRYYFQNFTLYFIVLQNETSQTSHCLSYPFCIIHWITLHSLNNIYHIMLYYRFITDVEIAQPVIQVMVRYALILMNVPQIVVITSVSTPQDHTNVSVTRDTNSLMMLLRVMVRVILFCYN